MNKLFDSYTWKFNSTGLAGKRSSEHYSKHGSGPATTHEPIIKAVLYYAAALKGIGTAAIGTNDTNTVVEVSAGGQTKLAIYSTATKRFMACNFFKWISHSLQTRQEQRGRLGIDFCNDADLAGRQRI